MAIERIITAVLISLFALAVLLAFRAVLFKSIHRWSERTKTGLDDLIIKTIRIPSILWVAGIALYTGLYVSEISSKYSFYFNRAIYVLIILSITVTCANLVSRLFTDYIQRTSVSIPSTGLLSTLLKGAIYIIGLIVILNIFDISIAPLITALGIGGLAVALALKDTLENLFAGIHIMAEKSIRIGDFVRLETGQEGYVEDISWRTTRIRMLSNNMIVIPNSKLAQSIVVNYFLPEKRILLQIPINVSYSSDPEKVEKILIEETKKAAEEVPGLLSEPEPFVRFIPGFGESSLDFTVVCHVREFVEQYSVQHELRKRIFKRFKEEGIEIPFPQRVVWLKNNGSST